MASDLLGSMRVEIVGDNTKLDKSIKTSQANTEKFAKKTSSLGKSLSGLFAGIGFAVVAKKLFDLGKQAENLFQIQEKAEAKLDATLLATGNAAGLTADELKKMASELQKVTTVGDEATIGAQSLLLTFKDIGGDVFPRALESILDVSEAMGQDLKSSTIQIGKALNDPVAGLTALSRVGIQFTKDQKALIKSFSEAGNKAAAQGIILEELESQFGGVARAAALTSEGIEKQLSNAYGDLLETIGSVISKGLIPYRLNLQKEVESINLSIKAHILRKKAVEGNATLIEELTLKQIEQQKAEERLAQAILNVDNAENQVLDTRYLSEAQILRIEASKAAAIKQAADTITALEDEVTLRKLGTKIAEENLEAENKLLEANIGLSGEIDDTTESTEANTLATDENTDAKNDSADSFVNLTFQANAYKNSLMSAEFAHRSFTSTTIKGLDFSSDAWNDYFETVTDNWEDSTSSALGFASDLFSSLAQLSAASAQSQIDDIDRILDARVTAIDAETQALLLSLGLQEETKTQKLQRQLDEAILSGDAETAAQLQDELDRTSIIEDGEAAKTAAIEEAELEKKQIEYDAAIVTWKLQKASAVASAAQALVTNYGQLGLVGGTIAAVGTGILTGVQLGIINENKPVKNFSQGGIVPGSQFGIDSVPAMLSPQETVLNPSQQARVLMEIANGNGGGQSSNNTVNINSLFSLGNDAKIRQAARVLFPAIEAEARRRGTSIVG